LYVLIGNFESIFYVSLGFLMSENFCHMVFIVKELLFPDYLKLLLLFRSFI